jgi:hypothetical protein
VGALGIALFALPRLVTAWPVDLVEALARDARRLVPRSLAQLITEREREILEEARALPPELSQALSADLLRGELSATTLAALEGRAGQPLELLKARRVSDSVVHLGALLRVPADLSDPVLSAGADGFAPGVSREYYAFVSASLGKIPVVLDDAAALKLQRRDLPAYWRGLLEKSRGHSGVIRTELFRSGRLVDHRTIDYRSPVFGVASLAYSRAVTGIAATWLAVWREARGDLTRMSSPRHMPPTNAPPLPPSARAGPPNERRDP